MDTFLSSMIVMIQHWGSGPGLNTLRRKFWGEDDGIVYISLTSDCSRRLTFVPVLVMLNVSEPDD